MTSSEGVVKPGYKRTEVGVIPIEWDTKRLRDVATIATGSTPPTSDSTNYGDDRLFVGPVDMGSIKQITHTEKRLSQKGFSISRRFPKDSILFVCIGSTIGKCGIASTELTSNQQINAIFPSTTFCADFLYYAVSAAAPRVRALAGEQAVPIVNKSQFSETRVALPLLREQHAISAALSNVDALLGGLDRLIAKKRDLKQAAMQQLLTGQTRLPGFHDKWDVMRLGALAEIVSGGTPKTSEPLYWNGGVKWCTPTDITACSGKYLIDTERFISSLGLRSSGARLLPAGALLLCSRATIGELKIASGEVCTNQGFKSLVCQPNVNNEFLYYKLLTMKAQMIERAFGSTFLEISTANVAALEILTPPLPEQITIANALSEMDAELSTLEARRAKTRDLKQAMMQELLTGRIRLV